MLRKIAPSGLPRCRSVWAFAFCEALSSVESEVFNRKSCVMATPIEAKESDVLSQARNVRSAKGKLKKTRDRQHQHEQNSP